MKHLKYIVLITLFAGCASQVPTTKLKLGNLQVELPKDMNAKKLVIKFDGTSGFTLTADTINSANNPNVIESAGAANVEVIKAHYEGAGNIIDKGIQAGIKGASKAIVP